MNDRQTIQIGVEIHGLMSHYRVASFRAWSIEQPGENPRYIELMKPKSNLTAASIILVAGTLPGVDPPIMVGRR